MQNMNDIMQNIIEKTQIKLNHHTISQEQLMKSFAQFLLQSVSKRDHNIGFVMHTGSVCFDVLALTYVAILSLINNKNGSREIVDSLQIGDVVLYGEKKKDRCIFEGVMDGRELYYEYSGKKIIKLRLKNNIKYITEKSWHFIEPYNGTSLRLDGRGLRKKSTTRDDFFEEVLGYEKNSIPAVIDTSNVVVIPKDKADALIKNISIQFNNKEIGLLDLITASYFTEEDEYRYGGNTGKNEATIKITGKLSVARTLLLSSQGNKQLGLLVIGDEFISRGFSELPELINRRSLKYVYLCSHIDGDLGLELLQDNEEIEVFACTKNYLVETIKGESEFSNMYTRELSQQVNKIINKENVITIVEDSPIVLDEYKLFKSGLIWLKRNDYISREKDNYIIYAHSLMNMFITSVFTMKQLDSAKEKGLIEVETPKEKISHLRNLSSSFPEIIKEMADKLITILTKMYEILQLNTGKATWLDKYLKMHLNEKVCIVVPKAYYIPIIRNSFINSYKFIKNVSLSTVGKFDNNSKYDLIIVVGDIEGKSFNAFRCNAATKTISLLYEVEKRTCYYRKKSVEEDTKYIEKRSKSEPYEIQTNIDEIPDSMELLEADKEINDYISSLDAMIDTYRFANYSDGNENNLNAEVVAVAIFSDETKAFFSKRYKGYVLDENTGNVRESSALGLREGDSLIITTNNNDTKDIVDSILSQLITENRLAKRTIDVYNISKMWKQTLIDYMNKNHITAREVARRMLENGIQVQEATILAWLDDDSHTVGPRKLESIEIIGEFTSNDEVMSRAGEIFDACREVRGIRRKILNQVGQAIIKRLSCNSPKDDEFSMIYNRVDSIARVVQIDRIVYSESILPASMVNRLLSI